MKKNVLFLGFVSLLLACTSNTIYEKPKDLIPKEKMVALLTDMFLANSAIISPNKSGKRNVKYTPLVYKKYHIDSAQFKRSNRYYTSNIKEYKAIYQEVLINIEKLEKKYKALQNKRDSIENVKKDSIKENMKKKRLKDPTGKSLVKEAKH